MRSVRLIAFVLIAMGFLSGRYAMSADGLITIRSGFGPKETMNRLEEQVRAKGMTVFAHIDHAAGAEAVGMKFDQKIRKIMLFTDEDRARLEQRKLNFARRPS